MMLAGLCHVIDHPGYSNAYLERTNHPLTKLYQESFLENHHVWLGLKLIEVSFELFKHNSNVIIFFFLENEHTESVEN